MSRDPAISVSAEADDERLRAGRRVATVVYALQAAALLMGVTFIAAVIVDYLKLADVRGTWLESHFRWQIRTFWFGALWALLGVATLLIAIGYPILIANTIWVIYRVAKGWLRLADGKAMYLEA